jgi:penicillin amidase
MLRDWDGDISVDSAAGALYAVWYYRHLRPSLAQVLLPDDPALVAPLGSPGVLRLMSEGRSQDAIAASLRSAYGEIVHALGDDPDKWRWGDLHKIHFEHPLLQLADNELAAQMTYPAYPRGGSGNTTNNTGFRPDDLVVRAGASYRQVIDVGNWDASRMTNAPGQSGDPRSRFYGNLLKDWAGEKSFPLLYDRAKVLQHRAFSIQLKPDKTSN